MKIAVQKFGGTSLSTEQARSRVIGHIRHAVEEDRRVVVVVSAMGRRGEPYATDTLLDWIAGNGNRLPARERDMLLGCGEIIAAATLCSLLHESGLASAVLNGMQAGIHTDLQYGNARIVSVDTGPLLDRLRQDPVVIVPGFQGCDGLEVTTLGRGGSDTTAVAVGAALQAEYVDIFTDVDGVLTADPNIVGDAQPLSDATYHEICHMAYQGAKVIHPRAVELAMQAGLALRIRSTFTDGQGTLIHRKRPVGNGREVAVADRCVTGIAHYDGITQIQVTSPQGQYDLQLQVFKAMARAGISVDFINVNPNDVVYTVYDRDADRAAAVLREISYQPNVMPYCAKVSVIGGGINGVPGIMAKIVETLTNEDIRILQSADSETTIWVLVRARDMAGAVRALHRAFGLHKGHGTVN